jgi:hypothetical protein
MGVSASGVSGFRVCGSSGGSSGCFRIGSTFTQAEGIWSSLNKNFVMSGTGIGSYEKIESTIVPRAADGRLLCYHAGLDKRG